MRNKVLLSIDVEDLKKLKIMCGQNSLTVTALIRLAIKHYLRRFG
jgi:hypothetical protein